MSKTVLVTGASSGIGKAVAKYLSEMGYQLVLVARSYEHLKEIAAELETETEIISYDLSDLENIESIFQHCKDKEWKLTGLVHCAGITNDMPIRVNDIQDMEMVTKVNYMSFIELGKHFSKKKYSEENSSMLAISSMAALTCQPGMCVYAASKAALNAAVKVMAKEFEKRRIRVNAIMPAFVETDMVKRVEDMSDAIQEKMKRQPFGMIEPKQVAYLTEFMLSDKSLYMTGTLIPITAGREY